MEEKHPNQMTQPRDPRPNCPPEPLEITEEEFRAAEIEQEEASKAYEAASTEEQKKWAAVRLQVAVFNWQDAQRRAASDHQTRMRDDPAYRRKVRERDYLP